VVASVSDRQRFGRTILVGAPVEAGANIAGSSLGPAALRAAGLPGMLGKLDCRADHGDLVPVGEKPASNPELECGRGTSGVARWIPSLSQAAYELARGRHVPVFLGGDHSLSMGTVEGIARACAEGRSELYLLWLDAHPDFNTPSTSPSGNPHGMSLAFLCGESGFEPVLGITARRAVDPRNVFILGMRSVDADEGEVLKRRGVNLIDMYEIRQRGITAPMRHILETVAEHDGVLHISLDVDFVDPSFIPAVNVPVPGGVSYAETQLIMQMLNESGLVASLDVAEFNPLLNADGQSARAIADLVACLFNQESNGHP